MAKRKPAFKVEEVLPDDTNLGQRNNAWRSFMETLAGPILLLSRFQPFGSLSALHVFKCPRHFQTVIEERLKLCLSCILRVLRAFRGWLELKDDRKRKLELPSSSTTANGGGSEAAEPPEDDEDFGEPVRKFAKNTVDETHDMDLDAAQETLNYDVTDESDVSDVECGGNDDSDQENREEVNKQLQLVVKKRKQNWQNSGLLKAMESIEDSTNRFNELSHQKVENWLLNRTGGSRTHAITQGQEMVVTEQNEDGDRMKFHRKQSITLSSKEDEDSLFSVDTAKYILENKNKMNNRNTVSKIKFTTTIKKYTTISTSSGALPGGPHPKLHSVSSFPAIEEERGSLRKSMNRMHSKSDSAIDTGEDLSQNISNERSAAAPQMLRSPPPKSRPTRTAPQVGKPEVEVSTASSKRKKVLKKTLKRKPSRKSPSADKVNSATQEYEEALQTATKVKKIPPVKAKQRIHWQETSSYWDCDQPKNSSSDKKTTKSPSRSRKDTKREPTKASGRDSSSSSESSSKDVFTRTRSRRRNRRISSTSESNDSPRKKSNSPRKSVLFSPLKTMDKDLVVPFEAICLTSPTKRITTTQALPPEPPQFNNDQTASNLTALFSGNNDKITNSTKLTDISAASASATASNTTAAKSRSRILGLPQQKRTLVIYVPKEIQPGLPRGTKVQITMQDLNLEGVTKPRHLEKFEKFNYQIHPNSSVHFFPSDSEDDLPPPQAKADDADESYDSDDPVMFFNLRETGRLNVMEMAYRESKTKPSDK